MESDNSLNITITAVDEASGVLSGLADTVSELGSELAPAIEQINTAFDSVSEAEQGFSQAFYDSLAAIDAAEGQYSEAAADINEVGDAFITSSTSVQTGVTEMLDSFAQLDILNVDSALIDESVLGIGTSFGEAASSISGSASEIEDQATAIIEAMQLMSTETAEAMQQVIGDTDTAAAKTGTSSLATGAGLLLVGNLAKQAGTALTGFYSSAVNAAGQVQTAQGQVTTALQGVHQEMVDLKDPTSAVSEEYKTLTDQADAARAKMEAAEVPVSGMNKTIGQLASAQTTQAAALQTASDQYDQIENKLDLFKNLNENANITVGDSITQYDAAAQSAMKLGFNYNDTLTALAQFTDATGDSKDAQSALQAAQDLSLATGMSLSNATTLVSSAYEGNGRQLAQYGIIVKDGATGQQALSAITAQTSTAAKNQQDTFTVATAAVSASWGKFMADLGNSQSPLGELLTSIENIINGLDSWTKAHPKLTEAIMIFVGILGGLLVVLGSLLIIIGTIMLAGVLLGTAISAPWILAGIAVVALVALIIANWSTVKAWFDDFIKWLEKTFDAGWDWIKGAAQSVGTAITDAFSAVKTFFDNLGKDIANAFIDAFNSVIDAIDTVIQGVNTLISVMDKIPGVKNILGTIPLIPHITAVDDAIISPGGNVITTNPNDFLIATQNPSGLLSGATAGGQGNGAMVINIQVTGDVLTTQQQAIKLGNELAKQIGRQTRLTSIK